MNRKQLLPLVFVQLLLLAACQIVSAATNETSAYLEAKPAMVIPGGAGKFDWMTIDTKGHRLLAAHRDKGTLEVVDLDTNKLLASVKTGACQGLACADNKYFVGDTKEQKLVILNAQSLKQISQVPVPGEIDALAYDLRNHKVYADHDDGSDIWVVPTDGSKTIAAIEIGGAPEFIQYDKDSDRLYQNIKTNNTVAVINPVSNKVEATWSTLPVEKPHGLAIDTATQRLFSAGSNGKLVVIDMKTGKVLATVDIEPRVDQIAFDSGNKRIYCACAGAISIVQETSDGAKLLESMSAHKGAHTLAVDAKTHSVWVSYADDKDSYLQRFDCLK